MTVGTNDGSIVGTGVYGSGTCVGSWGITNTTSKPSHRRCHMCIDIYHRYLLGRCLGTSVGSIDGSVVGYSVEKKLTGHLPVRARTRTCVRACVRACVHM